MMQKYTIPVLILAVLIGGVLLYQQNQNLNTQLITMQARMSAMMQQSRSGGDGKKQEDPYIAGAVKNTILKHYSDVGAIYKHYLAGKPQKKDGKIKVDWQITVDGRVLEAGLIFSELDAGSSMEKELLRDIASWHFPPPPSGMNRYVAHTFQLRSKPLSKEEMERQRQTQVDGMVQLMNHAPAVAEQTKP